MSRRILPWVIFIAFALIYPLALLARGEAAFPTRADCVQPATADGDLEVVFGRFASPDEAQSLLTRVLATGFKGSQIEPDGCGLFKVDVQGIPTLEVGGQVVAEAHTVSPGATVERVTS